MRRSKKKQRPAKKRVQKVAEKKVWKTRNKGVPTPLLYIAPEHIAVDFTSPAERRAIAAVFRWFSLNAVCAWEKRAGVYQTRFSAKSPKAISKRVLIPPQGYYVDKKVWEDAEELLGAAHFEDV